MERMDKIIIGISAAAAACMLFGMAVTAKDADTEIPTEYVQYCEEAGQAYSICPELLMALIEEESGGNPDAVGAAGEIGLMQVYPKYHLERMERLGMRYLFDPRENVFVAADYLAELFAEYGDAGTVLMAYNGTKDAAGRGGTGNYTEYARRVLKRSAQLERLHKK